MSHIGRSAIVQCGRDEERVHALSQFWTVQGREGRERLLGCMQGSFDETMQDWSRNGRNHIESCKKSKCPLDCFFPTSKKNMGTGAFVATKLLRHVHCRSSTCMPHYEAVQVVTFDAGDAIVSPCNTCIGHLSNKHNASQLKYLSD